MTNTNTIIIHIRRIIFSSTFAVEFIVYQNGMQYILVADLTTAPYPPIIPGFFLLNTALVYPIVGISLNIYAIQTMENLSPQTIQLQNQFIEMARNQDPIVIEIINMVSQRIPLLVDEVYGPGI